MNPFLTTLLLTAIVYTTSCSKSPGESPEPPEPPIDSTEKPIAVYETTGTRSKLMQRSNIGFDNQSPTTALIDINFSNTYQEIDGFGAALTGSSAQVLNRNLSSAARNTLLKELFTKEGIGINYLRLTIGASDFSTRSFTYNEVVDDTLMTAFTLADDLTDVVPVLKEILQLNPNLHIMASPWTAPPWMKTSNHYNGGKLKTQYYAAYARYLAAYIKSMKEQGIDIDAITVQNEPLHETAAYPSMLMYAEEQRDFIKLHLGPLLRTENINTKIIAYDHNWDKYLYGDTVLKDPGAAEFIAGTAFHAYAGTFGAMGLLKSLHPDKDLFFTEISGGRWATNFGDNLRWYGENILVGPLRNFSRNALFWNLALNENDGPKNNGCSNCRGVVTVSTSGAVTKNEEYYAIGHFGRFLAAGAKRVESNDISADQIKNVAFINTDGSKVVFAFNRGTTAKTVTFRSGGKLFRLPMESNTIYTIVWD